MKSKNFLESSLISDDDNFSQRKLEIEKLIFFQSKDDSDKDIEEPIKGDFIIFEEKLDEEEQKDETCKDEENELINICSKSNESQIEENENLNCEMSNNITSSFLSFQMNFEENVESSKEIIPSKVKHLKEKSERSLLSWPSWRYALLGTKYVQIYRQISEPFTGLSNCCAYFVENEKKVPIFFVLQTSYNHVNMLEESNWRMCLYILTKKYYNDGNLKKVFDTINYAESVSPRQNINQTNSNYSSLTRSADVSAKPMSCVSALTSSFYLNINNVENKEETDKRNQRFPNLSNLLECEQICLGEKVSSFLILPKFCLCKGLITQDIYLYVCLKTFSFEKYCHLKFFFGRNAQNRFLIETLSDCGKYQGIQIIEKKTRQTKEKSKLILSKRTIWKIQSIGDAINSSEVASIEIFDRPNNENQHESKIDFEDCIEHNYSLKFSLIFCASFIVFFRKSKNFKV